MRTARQPEGVGEGERERERGERVGEKQGEGVRVEERGREREEREQPLRPYPVIETAGAASYKATA